MAKVMIIKMDNITIKNLKVFLDRADLKGSEVGEFYKVIKALSEATPCEGGGEDS